MPISILSEQLASQIAAGEVVERPASVVKELIENAIDAGASSINIDIRAAGRELIQVADDGEGIPEDQLETAFMRHATSKLSTVEDLNEISTLGFRGEALAAIAAVSQITVISRVEGQNAGVRLTLEGAKKTSRESVGAPVGTVLAVANLFFNVPARLNFLKSSGTEKRLIDEAVIRYALACPQVRMRLTHDGRITFQTTGSGRRQDVLLAVYGPETAKQLIQIGGMAQPAVEKMKSGVISVDGFISPPHLNWSNRNRIIIYVNERWIKDSRLTYAIIQAYHTLLPTGRYPMAVVFLTIPFEEVDVNVHPAKTEVRFRQMNQVFSAVQRGVRRELVGDRPAADGGHFSSLVSQNWAQPGAWLAAGSDQHGSTGSITSDHDSQGTAGPASSHLPGFSSETGEGYLPIMRVIGQVGAAYIIAEGPDGMYLIDQHAAHERILYERFMSEWDSDKGQAVATQSLISSQAVDLTPDQMSLLEEQFNLLGKMGFDIEPFGPKTIMVRGVPSLLTTIDPARALMGVVEELEQGEEPMKEAKEARIILRVCKSAAVKAGQILSQAEMEAMIRQLEACRTPLTCPHGRPTTILLSVSQLAREFGRT